MTAAVKRSHDVGHAQRRAHDDDVILRGDDGKLYKKTWVLEGYLTRKISEAPYTPPPAVDSSEKTAPSTLTDQIRTLLDQ